MVEVFRTRLLALIQTAVFWHRGPPPKVLAISLSSACLSELSAVLPGLTWLGDGGVAGGRLAGCLPSVPTEARFRTARRPVRRLSVLLSHMLVRPDASL